MVGSPVQQSASPAMHMAAFRAMELPHLYEAIDCPTPESLKRALNLLKRGYFAGLNVTAPHKGLALELAGSADPEVLQVGATNTLRVVEGVVHASNTDIPAMVEQLQGAQVRLGVALVIGSGGAARAAVDACLRLGVRVIGITSRAWVDSETLYESTIAEAFRERRVLTFPWPGVVGNTERNKGSIALQLQWAEFATMADVIIQATSAGLHQQNPGDPVARAIPWDRVPDHALAYELIYGPSLTPFTIAAIQRGLRVLDGIELLARQGARSLSQWLQQPVPYEVMLEAARQRIFKG